VVMAATITVAIGLAPRPGTLTETSAMERACLAFCLLQLLFVVLVGGDWMPGRRFFVPMLIPMCWLAARNLRLWPRFIAVVMVGFLWIAVPVECVVEETQGYRFLDWLRRHSDEGGLDRLALIGEDVKGLAKPGDTIALTEAGIVPWVTDLRVIDMLGLVDREIASVGGSLHETHDAGMVLRRRPEWILLGFIAVDKVNYLPAWAPDAGIAAHADFAAHYEEAARWDRAMAAPGSPRAQKGRMILYRLTPSPEGGIP